ncbi:MAG TPA: hypothetical protein VEG30_12985 [Terriglobales bacterium]|nr:hypothetical protein [Terriglobales bacterium]
MHNPLTYLWQDPTAAQNSKTAVSLHGHTNHSKESLYFIMQFAQQYGLLRWALEQKEKRAQQDSAIKLDFWKAYWTPPLPALAAYDIERRQIEEQLEIEAMISLTDHDNIEAPMLLRVVPEARRIPVSLEWSVPYEETIFHLGVHNLPTAEAEPWTMRLLDYAKKPDPAQLRSLVAALSDIPQVLLVFNHPLWDLPRVGRDRHLELVHRFASEIGEFLHAYELGGLRGWEENEGVMQLAKAYGKPVISGGDRHGCEPSAILNLTNATSFSEFVDEVRHGQSHVLFMPQYAESTTLRTIQTLLDVIRNYPEHPAGFRSWDERVFHPDREGVCRPLAALWRQPPAFIGQTFAVLRLFECEPIRGVLRMANGWRQGLRVNLGEGQEALP